MTRDIIRSGACARCEAVHAWAKIIPAFLPHQILCLLQVLSNLQSQWYLLWMDDTEIHRCCFATRAHAAKVINNLLAGRMECQPVIAGQGDIELSMMHRHRIAEGLAPC